jgi:hypothetical protein
LKGKTKVFFSPKTAEETTEKQSGRDTKTVCPTDTALLLSSGLRPDAVPAGLASEQQADGRR